MFIEAFYWFLDKTSFVLVPTSNQDLTGDLGLRSYLKINKDDSLLNISLERVLYSEKEFFLYSNYNIINFLILLNGNDINPIYSSKKENSTLFFENFDNELSKYNVGDKVIIVDKDDYSKILNTEILSLNGINSITFSDEINFQSNRYKIISNSGEKYNFYSLDFNIMKNHKLKLGCILNGSF